MLIHVRNNNYELQIKDILDIDFDMKVEKINDNSYVVRLNSKYTADGKFSTRKEAEETMIQIANSRNNLEIELKNL